MFENRHVVQTDFAKQEESSPLSFFQEKRFSFRMPRGRFDVD